MLRIQVCINTIPKRKDISDELEKVLSIDGEMKPHEAPNNLSQSVGEMVHYLKLHMHRTPPTGRVYNHRQLYLSHIK